MTGGYSELLKFVKPERLNFFRMPEEAEFGYD